MGGEIWLPHYRCWLRSLPGEGKGCTYVHVRCRQSSFFGHMKRKLHVPNRGKFGPTGLAINQNEYFYLLKKRDASLVEAGFEK